MSVNELAARIDALAPAQRRLVETLVMSLGSAVGAPRSDLANHPSFGAWSQRQDLAADSDIAARELRRQASHRASVFLGPVKEWLRHIGQARRADS